MMYRAKFIGAAVVASVAVAVVAVIGYGRAVDRVAVVDSSFQEHCRTKLYDLRDAAVAGVEPYTTGERDPRAEFRQWVIDFTEYVDQCVEKRK